MPSLREYVVACPSCHAMHPSLDETNGTWRCACGNSGDLFDYVMQTRNCTFAEALKLLGGDAGIQVEDAGRHGPPS